MAAHAVLGAICKDVEVVGMVCLDIVEFIFFGADMSFCFGEFT